MYLELSLEQPLYTRASDITRYRGAPNRSLTGYLALYRFESDAKLYRIKGMDKGQTTVQRNVPIEKV